ncbi:hypothetical protein [Elizabethkingia miricola]|uniref:hypothetical protein n=1 Tax=Elizabethkingia miricola TaxID=172045 RepID=UPI00389141F9
MEDSAIVDSTARDGTYEWGKKEFTSAVYRTNLFQPEDCVPQRFNLLNTADKNPAASTILNRKTAISCLTFIRVIFSS